MSYLKFHPVNNTHGFAVEKMQKEFRVVFVRKEKDELVKEATSYSNGRMRSYSSPFLAEYAIKTEILPLYPKNEKR